MKKIFYLCLSLICMPIITWADSDLGAELFEGIIIAFLFGGVFSFIMIKAVIEALKYNNKKDRVKNEDLAKYDIHDIDDLKNELYKVYLDIQYAWMEFDYDKLRNLCTDELFNSYKSQLEVLNLKKGKNIMSDFCLNCIKVTGIKDSNDLVIVDAKMDIAFFDYIINTETNKVTGGVKGRKITNYYEMTFVRHKEQSGYVTCPSCGKDNYVLGSGECEYCHSVIVNNGKCFILSKKESKKTV